HPHGGMFVWVTLPPGIDAKRLLERAINHARVAFVPGAAFFTDHGGANTLRLSFSLVPPETVNEGVRRLGAVAAEALATASHAGPKRLARGAPPHPHRSGGHAVLLHPSPGGGNYILYKEGRFRHSWAHRSPRWISTLPRPAFTTRTRHASTLKRAAGRMVR